MYAMMHTTEQLIQQAQPTTFASAPKAVQDAVNAVGAAQTQLMNATDAVSDGEMNIPQAQADWDNAGKVALRAGKPLPSRDPLDTARLGLAVAQEDEKTSRAKLQAALGNVAGLLGQASVRDEWRDNIDTRLLDLDANLIELASKATVAVSEKTVAVGVSHYIGQWRSQSSPENYLYPTDPIGALHAAANLKAYRDPTPAPVAQVAV